MSVRKFQHSKVIKHALKANPATNPSLKEINVPSVRRRIMNLLEMMLTMWEDARPLRKMKGGIGTPGFTRLLFIFICFSKIEIIFYGKYKKLLVA